MKLGANDPLLGAQPEQFFSPFPSDDALMSPRFLALMKGVDPASPGAQSQGARIMAQAQARAWRAALAACNRAKVTIVGDLPSAWLPEVAAFRTVRPGVEALTGLWAQVAFPQASSPEALALAVADVGLDLALDFLGAVPIVGSLMKWILNLGGMIGRLFAAPEPAPVKSLLLPWVENRQQTDEELVQTFLIDQFFAGVDWTNIFAPPYEAVPWSQAQAERNGQVIGSMWAPIKGGQIAHSSSGLGAMPGTFRMAGLIQSPNVPQADARLLRYFSDATMLHWGRTLTDTGEFYPATAQTATLAWQQADRIGSPDMYKIDCDALERGWSLYFDQFFDSLWSAFQGDEWIGEFAAPYLAVKGKGWRLGLRNPERATSPQLQRPHPAPLITPTIFSAGAGTPATRNPCLYLEPNVGPYGVPLSQIDREPKSISSAGSLAAVYKREKGTGRALASGGPAWPLGKPLPPGSRCVAWPDGEELLVKYQRPDVALILPAVKRLAARQRWALRNTLVAAYVRVDGPDAYAAFRGPPGSSGAILATLARDVRQKLLVHPARFGVNLRDVADIDPAFEKALRKAGVTNGPQQSGFALVGAQQQNDEQADPAPAALAPQGGLPFDAPPTRPSGGSGGSGGAGLLLGLGLGAAGIAAAAAMRGGSRVRR